MQYDQLESKEAYSLPVRPLVPSQTLIGGTKDVMNSIMVNNLPLILPKVFF